MTRSGKGPRHGGHPPSASAGPTGWLRSPPVRLLIAGLVFAVFLALAVVAGILIHFHRRAADYDIDAVGRLPMESEVLDASGERIGYLHGEHVGMPVELDAVSDHFLRALVAREDSRFYEHGGVDPAGVVRAWLSNLRARRPLQGASTLTMQLARMTYDLREKTMRRKLLEMVLARRIEEHYSKEEILSQYVNRIFLGTGMNGIEQAARGYFGKSAAELTLPESAMIAGVIRAPNGLSPFRHYETARGEMADTLGRMADEDMISSQEVAELSRSRPEVLSQARWMEMLREQSKVSSRTYPLDMVEERLSELLPSLTGVGGLTVRTTFDTRLQEAADRAVENRLRALEASPDYPHPTLAEHREGEPAYLQAAAVVVENYTGAMRAVVGGREHAHSAYNRAVRAHRTTGSIFKPFVYGTAFERGLFPGVLVSDAAIEPGEIARAPDDWRPENADGTFGGLRPAAAGLVRSRNTMTIRVGDRAGLENVLAMMEHAGLAPAESADPTAAIYIGTAGASVRDVASAYSSFATGGIRHRPHFIASVHDRDGSLLHRQRDDPYRVLSPGAAWMTSRILERVLEEGGTGAEVRDRGFDAPAGGKTGTTDDFHDAWFAGYTSRLAGAVWVGLDRPDTIAEGAYGGRVAMPVWRDIMTEARRLGYDFGELERPDEIIEMRLCRRSGCLATEACQAAREVYVEQVPHDLIPREFCKMH